MYKLRAGYKIIWLHFFGCFTLVTGCPCRWAAEVFPILHSWRAEPLLSLTPEITLKGPVIAQRLALHSVLLLRHRPEPSCWNHSSGIPRAGIDCPSQFLACACVISELLYRSGSVSLTNLQASRKYLSFPLFPHNIEPLIHSLVILENYFVLLEKPPEWWSLPVRFLANFSFLWNVFKLCV